MKPVHALSWAIVALTSACTHRGDDPLAQLQNYPQGVHSPAPLESWQHKAWREATERKARELHLSGAAKSFSEALGQAQLLAGPEPTFQEPQDNRRGKNRVVSAEELDKARGKRE